MLFSVVKFVHIFIFVLLHLQVRHSVANELDVYEQVFKNYQKNVRPVKNISTTTMVEIRPIVFVVTNMEPATESVYLSLDFLMVWTDEYLQWDPADFDGIETLRVPENLIWLPDIILVNSYQSTPLIGEDRRKIQINYDGTVKVWNPQIVIHYCAMVIDSFPYDMQTCTITLSAWTSPGNIVAVHIQPPTSSVLQFQSSTSRFRGNPEWEMISFNTTNCNFTDTADILHIHAKMITTLKRNHVYYISVLIVPTFVITTLCLLGIFAPFSSTGDREEKVTLGLTTLLTIAVILNAVATEMPKTCKLPLLGWFVLGELLICTLAVLVAILIMFLHQRVFLHHYEPPIWLSLILWCKVNRIDHLASRKNEENAKSIDETPDKTNAILNDLHLTLELIRSEIEKQSIEELLHYHWSTIIDRIDLLLLIGFQVGNIFFAYWLML